MKKTCNRLASWLAIALGVGMGAAAQAALPEIDSVTGLPTSENYAKTVGMTADGFVAQTVSEGTRFVLGKGEYNGGGTYCFDVDGVPLRLTTGTYDAETDTVKVTYTQDDSVKLLKPVRAASLYLDGARFTLNVSNALKDVPAVYVKGHIYTSLSSFSSDFFFSPSNYEEANQPALTHGVLRIEANPTTLSGTVTLLPKVEGDKIDCVRFSSHSSVRTLKIETLDLSRVAMDGETVMDLQNVALEVGTVKLPPDFVGALSVSAAGNGAGLCSVRSVFLGSEKLPDAEWMVCENVLKVRTGIYMATADSAEATFPEGVTWSAGEPTYDGTETASLKLTQPNSVITLNPEKPLKLLKLAAGNEAVTSVTLVVPQALPYAIDWGTLKGTVRLTAPTGTVASTSAYDTVLAATESVAEALTLRPSGGTLTMESGIYENVSLQCNGTQTKLNFYGGNLTLPNDLSFGTATIGVSGGTINASTLRTSDGGWGRNTSIRQTGGDITLSGTTDGSWTSATILLGHWMGGSETTYVISGGSLRAEQGGMRLGHQAASTTLTIQGEGAVTTKGIWSGAAESSTLNLEGGELCVGAWGVRSTFGFNLKGGTYIATASHTLASAMTAAENTVTQLNAAAEQTLTISGAISGAGTLVLNGEGEVLLPEGRLEGFSGALELRSGTLTLAAADLEKVKALVSGSTLKIVAGTLGEQTLTLPSGSSLEGVNFIINDLPAKGTISEDGTVTVTPELTVYTLTLPAGETLLSQATVRNAEGGEVSLSDLGAYAKLCVTASQEATLVADVAAAVKSLSFEVSEGGTLTLKTLPEATAMPLTTPMTEVSGNLCAVALAGALGDVFVAEGGEFAWKSSSTAGAPTRVYGAGTFRVLPNATRWDANKGLGVTSFTDAIQANPLGRFVLDGDASEIRATLNLPAETLLEVRNDAEVWPTETTLNSPVRVTGSVREANTWNDEGFGFLRKSSQTFNAPVTIEEGGEAMLGDTSNTTYTFNETVSGAGTLIAGPWYGTYTTTMTLNKALPEGVTLGGLVIRNTGKGNGATGKTSVTAAQDTLRGAAVAFTAGHGSTQPNISRLTLTGSNEISALCATVGGTLLLSQPEVALTVQEACSLEGNFALGGMGTLKAHSMEVKGTLRNTAREAYSARYIRWNLQAYCPSGPNPNAYALAEIGLRYQGGEVDLSGATLSASSVGGGHAASRLIDGQLGTDNKWMSNGAGAAWVKMDAGEGKKITFDAYRLAMADQTGRNPRKWNVQISNDNTNWTTIDVKEFDESFAMNWCEPNSWVLYDFCPAASIETAEGLTVKEGGTFVYDGTRLVGNVTCEGGSTLSLPQAPLTVEGTLLATGPVTLSLPEGAQEGDRLVTCAGATEASAANFTTDDEDLKVVADASGYLLAKNVTLQTDDGTLLPPQETLISAAYEAGLRGPVTVKAASAAGSEAAAAVADLLACFTGLEIQASKEDATLTLIYDFGVTRAAAKPVTVDGTLERWLVVEAKLQTPTDEANFTEGTSVVLELLPQPEGGAVEEVTGWDAATPGSTGTGTRYFRIPLNALSPTTTFRVRATR